MLEGFLIIARHHSKGTHFQIMPSAVQIDKVIGLIHNLSKQPTSITIRIAVHRRIAENPVHIYLIYRMTVRLGQESVRIGHRTNGYRAFKFLGINPLYQMHACQDPVILVSVKCCLHPNRRPLLHAIQSKEDRLFTLETLMDGCDRIRTLISLCFGHS
ncbi:hypothetical protein D3C78_568970 [compost metagenome]